MIDVRRFVLRDVVVFCSGGGVCYYDGKGGKNHAREAQWFRRSAQNGLPEGIYRWGLCCYLVDGVTKAFDSKRVFTF
ncbi:MAG: hypothetical protein PHX74_01410 [Candidatus Sumerlaeales bacterium]|nr:hypothetical protein [Candidatus Sumerlaeales bacterium]